MYRRIMKIAIAGAVAIVVSSSVLLAQSGDPRTEPVVPTLPPAAQNELAIAASSASVVRRFGPAKVVETTPWYASETLLGAGVLIELDRSYGAPFALPTIDARDQFDEFGHQRRSDAVPEGVIPPPDAWLSPTNRLIVDYAAGNLRDLVVFLDIRGNVLKAVQGPQSDVTAREVEMPDHPGITIPLEQTRTR